MTEIISHIKSLRGEHPRNRHAVIARLEKRPAGTHADTVWDRLPLTTDDYLRRGRHLRSRAWYEFWRGFLHPERHGRGTRG